MALATAQVSIVSGLDTVTSTGRRPESGDTFLFDNSKERLEHIHIMFLFCSAFLSFAKVFLANGSYGSDISILVPKWNLVVKRGLHELLLDKKVETGTGYSYVFSCVFYATG